MWCSAPKLPLTSLSSCLIFHFIVSVEWDWIWNTAFYVNNTVLQVSNSQSSRRVHWSAWVFLCSRCWWDLRGNMVRMKAAGSLSIILKLPIWSYVLLHLSCFDTFLLLQVIITNYYKFGSVLLQVEASSRFGGYHAPPLKTIAFPIQLSWKDISEVVLYPSVIVPATATTSELGFQNLSKFCQH